jgi:hypothetical protein
MRGEVTALLIFHNAKPYNDLEATLEKLAVRVGRAATIAEACLGLSFGISSLTKLRSFPQKRESSLWNVVGAVREPPLRRLAGWIPAFAGMTAACSAPARK